MVTILDKIAENALKEPERIAYCLYDGRDGLKNRYTLTWAELDDFSDRLAFYLDRTLKTNTPVIVYGHKHPYMLVCFLACVKSGRAYCPIDSSVPLNRVEAIIDRLVPEVIFDVGESGVNCDNVLSLEKIEAIIEAEEGTIDKDKAVSADDVFYIIFTSGSTGIPKGVQITRDCLDHFLEWARHGGGVLREGRHYTFINQAPFSFDLSVLDLYVSLYLGGTLWAIDKVTQGNMGLLLKSLEMSGANVWVSTPSFADLCLSDKKFSEKMIPQLELFLFCGEILTNRTVDRLNGAFPGAQIVNMYGPTESTVAVTEVLITPELNNSQSPLPVGKEKTGTHIFIMDEQGGILPEGRQGEIVIAGDTVSVGYWKNAELNKKVFGVCEVDGKKYRLYHTGDKGYKAAGQLYYCGRIDLQIKLHGYRIEVEDIESNIMRLAGIDSVAVMPVWREDQVKSLTAFVVAKEMGDSFEASQRIRKELKKYLPEYMIPKKIVFLDRLPMTNNGKVDRKALEGNTE